MVDLPMVPGVDQMVPYDSSDNAPGPMIPLFGGAIPPSFLIDGTGGSYTQRGDGLYVYSLDGSLWILCGDSDGAFGIDINGSYYAQAYP